MPARGRSLVPVSPARTVARPGVSSERAEQHRGVPPHVARRAGPGRAGDVTRDAQQEARAAGVGPLAVTSVAPGLIQVRLVGERVGSSGPRPPRAMLRLSALLSSCRSLSLDVDDGGVRAACGVGTAGLLQVGPKPWRVNGQRRRHRSCFLSRTRSFRPAAAQVHRRDRERLRGGAGREPLGPGAHVRRRRRLAREERASGRCVDARAPPPPPTCPHMLENGEGDRPAVLCRAVRAGAAPGCGTKLRGPQAARASEQ